MKKEKKTNGYPRVRERLRQLSVRQTDVAELLGICPASVHYKLGGYGDFTVREMAAMCRFYGLDEQLFMEDAYEMPKMPH